MLITFLGNLAALNEAFTIGQCNIKYRWALDRSTTYLPRLVTRKASTLCQANIVAIGSSKQLSLCIHRKRPAFPVGDDVGGKEEGRRPGEKDSFDATRYVSLGSKLRESRFVIRHRPPTHYGSCILQLLTY
jgi:hypothetical protein